MKSRLSVGVLVIVGGREVDGHKPSPIKRILSEGSKGRGVLRVSGFGLCDFLRWGARWVAYLVLGPFLELGMLWGFWRSFRLLLRAIARGIFLDSRFRQPPFLHNCAALN